MGLRPEADGVLDHIEGNSDKQYTYEWTKATREPYTGCLFKTHYLESSNTAAQWFRAGELLVKPDGSHSLRVRTGAERVAGNLTTPRPCLLPASPRDGGQLHAQSGVTIYLTRGGTHPGRSPAYASIHG